MSLPMTAQRRTAPSSAPSQTLSPAGASSQLGFAPGPIGATIQEVAA